MGRLFFILLFSVISLSTLAQTGVPVASDATYNLVADKVYSDDGVTYTAEGNVTITFKNTQITADKINYNPQTEIVEAVGNVTAKDDVQEFRADRIIYSVADETGTIDNATGTLAGEYYVCADRVDRLGKEYYMMEGVRITTCSNPFPEWSFSFQRATAEVDGYLIGDHATGNIKDFPYIYTPKLFYPLKFERQTGLLIPTVGYSSDLGSIYTQKFFWAMDLDKDLTLGVNAFSNRGFMGISEFRYAISPESKIYLSGEAISDSESSANIKGRWRYTSKSIVKLPHNFEVTADADTVSDFMYMRDFSRYSIYDGNLRNRENVFSQQYNISWSSQLTELTLKYKDDKKYKDVMLNNRPTGYRETNIIQKPSISAEQFNIDIGFFKVDYYGSWDNIAYQDATYWFDNRTANSNNQEYQRYTGIGEIYKTFSMPFMKITPSITGYYTKWANLDEDYFKPKTERVSSFTYLHRSGNGFERVIPKFSLKSNINEIYKFYGKGKHGILSTFEYTFVEELDQTGLPNYLEYDRIEKKNEVDWTLRSYYSVDKWNMDLRLNQGISINSVDDKPFLPLEIKSGISKSGLFSNSLTMELDYYSNKDSFGNQQSVVSFTDSLRVIITKTSYITATYDYDRDVANFNTSLKLGAGIKIGALDLAGTITWKGQNPFMTLNNIVPTENTISASWTSQCWSAGLFYSSEKYTALPSTTLQRDYTVGLNIGLRGLGESQMRVYSNVNDYD